MRPFKALRSNGPERTMCVRSPIAGACNPCGRGYCYSWYQSKLPKAGDGDIYRPVAWHVGITTGTSCLEKGVNVVTRYLTSASGEVMGHRIRGVPPSPGMRPWHKAIKP